MPARRDLDCQVEVTDLTTILNEQETTRLATIPKYVLEQEHERGVWDVSVVLTDDDHLATLHADHLGDPSVTDIMTFPYEDENGARSGELVISIDRARSQASEAGWSLQAEIAYLVIHGVLHLLGWDDQNERDRTRMHARQKEMLDAYPGPQ